MHTLNLGVLQTLVAECILYLCENDVYQGDDIDERLQNAYNSFRAWCRSHKIGCSQRLFRSATLHLVPDDYPWIGAKAFNCRVLMAWLADFWLCQFRLSFSPESTALYYIKTLYLQPGRP